MGSFRTVYIKHEIVIAIPVILRRRLKVHLQRITAKLRQQREILSRRNVNEVRLSLDSGVQLSWIDYIWSHSYTKFFSLLKSQCFLSFDYH